jgi:hypothetical protein
MDKKWLLLPRYYIDKKGLVTLLTLYAKSTQERASHNVNCGYARK